jgi:Cu(I)/Ag(I) efflux system membrane fusion protein
LTVNQEQIQTISARAMGRIEKLYFKTTGEYVKKNQAIYKLYSEDIATKQDYFSIHTISHAWRFWQNASMLQTAKQKLLFYGLSNAQIESIKGKKFRHTLLYSTADIFRKYGTEGSYVMEGAAISWLP